MTKKKEHLIRSVSDKTGLSHHVLRIWERRYKAVIPNRSVTKRRYYSEDDIERLRLLKILTEHGHRIGQVAQLPLDELKELKGLLKKTGVSEATTATNRENLIEGCLEAIQNLDPHALDIHLAQSSVLMSPMALIEELMTPLLEQMGNLWRNGKLRTYHCQFAATVLRPFLFSTIKLYNTDPRSPFLVTALLQGQFHEFGAFFAMSAAAAMGWKTIYLGPNLPIEEIAAAVHQLQAPLMMLSLVFPFGDALLHNQLKKLKSLLPAHTKLIVGGPAAPSYVKILDEINAIQFKDLGDFQNFLNSLHYCAP